MLIGLISDTHGLVRPDALEALRGVDLILHAGDVGGAAVLRALRTLAPVEAVCGNTDDPYDPALVRERSVQADRFTIHVSHGHELGRPTPEKLADAYAADIVVYGHTHRQLAVWVGEQLIINPGAAGPRRFDLMPSVARLTVGAEGDPTVEFVDLAP